MKKKFIRQFILILMVCLFLSANTLADITEWTCPNCGNAASGNFCNNCGRKYTDFETLVGLSREMADMLASVTNRETVSLYGWMNSANLEIIDRLHSGFTGKESIQKTVLVYTDVNKLKQFLLPLQDLVGQNIWPLLETRITSLPSLPINLMNSQGGTAWVAVSSLLNVSRLQVLPDYADSMAVLLLKLGEDMPGDIWVSVYAAGDGAALINASFVKIPDEILNLLTGIANGSFQQIITGKSITGYPEIDQALKDILCSIPDVLSVEVFD